MTYSSAGGRAQVVWMPMHLVFTPFPAVCFFLTLLTDIAYWQTSNLIWQHFSSWLLLAGLVFGGLAIVAAIVDLLLGTRFSPYERAWLYLIGNLLVLALAFINSLVHAGDGWTAVVPTGLVLSAATVAVGIAISWAGRAVTVRNVRREDDHG